MFYCKFCNREFQLKSSHTQHEKYYCKLNPNRQQANLTTHYVNHHKTECSKCGKMFDVANIKRHESACGKPFLSRRVTHDGLECEFCKKICKNKNSLAQHELRCPKNPNRKAYDSFIGFMANETIEEKAKRFEDAHNTLKQRLASGEIKYNSQICYNYKYGTYKGYHCDSSWELAFVIYHLDHNIVIVKNDTPFLYMHNGISHTYYPDFIIDDVYYEIKGYFDDKTLSKIRDFPNDKQLIVLDYAKVKKYLDYCEATYGKDYIRLYDRNYPSWMDNEDKEN